jgi:glycosyltransferase involved in cell wall biosynthesis
VAERSVLHVLPHPGGGGERYVDLLEDMPGYRLHRIYLAPGPTPSRALARGVIEALRRGRGEDLVHVHGEVGSGLCLPLVATRPSVISLHGLNLTRRLNGLRREAALLNLRAIVRAAHQTICVSRAELAELVAMVGSAATTRAVVVHNGVRPPAPPTELNRADTRGEFGIAGAEPAAIWVGSLHDHKDPLAAVRAAELASVTLLVVGDGPLRSQVERTAKQHVRVFGHRDDVPRLLAAADFFVLTSRHEGFSFSLLEAMASGLPAVITDLPENVEAVGETGVVVPVGDEAALAAALQRVAANEGERAALGEQASHRVAVHFSAEAMIGRTSAIYDDVLG